MEVELLKWWENHQHGTQSRHAVIQLIDERVVDVFSDPTDEGFAHLLGLPALRTRREDLIGSVESYNRQLGQVQACPQGCFYDHDTLENLHCTGGVRLHRRSLGDIWEEEVASCSELADINPRLVIQILELDRMRRSGEVHIIEEFFELETEAFLKYHNR